LEFIGGLIFKALNRRAKIYYRGISVFIPKEIWRKKFILKLEGALAHIIQPTPTFRKNSKCYVATFQSEFNAISCFVDC